MNPPAPRKLAVLLAIAALLAAMTMGNLSICDVIVGVPHEADTLTVNVQAGQPAEGITSSLSEAYMFRLCPPGAVSGVYPITRFFVDPQYSFRIVDLATSPTSPPGHYFINYTESYLDFLYAETPILAYGVLDLTITPGPLLAACFHSQAEIIQVNIPVRFDAACSTGSIVQYKWWFNYDIFSPGPPSTTTTGPTVQTTYGSAGERVVRLVVRTAGGQEAEVTHTYYVLPPYAVQVGP